MTKTRSHEYDVIVVGARCAGAPLATFLARAGKRVLLLDKDVMPSDCILSTHNVHAAGMDVLDDLGVGDAVRSGSPASQVIRMDVEGAFIDFAMLAPAYCPRRERLDGLLQRAAVGAGVEMLDRARVVALVREQGGVRGVRSVIDGEERVLTARMVVGADGRRSSVARMTGSEEYLGYDAPRVVFWGYWDAPPIWRTDPAFRFDMYFGHRNGNICAIFQTDRDQLVVGGSPPAREAEAWRTDPEGRLRAMLEADPIAARLIHGARRDGRILGAVKERYFFRRAVGDGWALAGDAGLHKEFLLGDGITEALLQARSLAAAIAEGTDAALVRWWRARDVAVLPLYSLGQEIAGPQPPLELMKLAFSRLDSRPKLKARLAEVLARECSPFDAIPASEALAWVVTAAGSGRWGLLREFLNAGRRVSVMNRELHARRRLLAEAERSDAALVRLAA